MKLVRDKIPEIAPARKFRTATPEELPSLLAAKLVEEANEFKESGRLEELADLYEVLSAVAKLNNWSMDQIIETATAKAHKRGKFEKRIVLID